MYRKYIIKCLSICYVYIMGKKNYLICRHTILLDLSFPFWRGESCLVLYNGGHISKQTIYSKAFIIVCWMGA